MKIVESSDNKDDSETGRFLNNKDSLDDTESKANTLPKMATQAWVYIVFWICKKNIKNIHLFIIILIFS